MKPLDVRDFNLEINLEGEWNRTELSKNHDFTHDDSSAFDTAMIFVRKCNQSDRIINEQV
jgi:hypothetical protein